MLNLLFRPVLLVFSLACAMLAMSAIFGLLAGGIAGMLTDMSSRSTDWVLNAFMIIGAVVVIVTAAETVIVQSLSLLFHIPTNVFAWLGAQYGSDVGRGIDAIGQQAGGAITSAGGNAGRRFGGNVPIPQKKQKSAGQITPEKPVNGGNKS